MNGIDGTPTEPSADQERASRRPPWQRVLIGVAVAVVGVLGVGLALYAFGGMGGSANDPEMREQYTQLVADGQVTVVEKRFVIPIPGCTCHSTDPVQTELHRYYRINECSSSGCHGS